MASIPEKIVAQVVGEVSERMKDRNYAQLAIGGFIETHPDVGRWLSAQNEALGSEGVMHAIFHAEVISECFERHADRAPKPVRFTTLNAATRGGDPKTRLRESQPALADYVDSNVEAPAVQRVLALITLALEASL